MLMGLSINCYEPNLQQGDKIWVERDKLFYRGEVIAIYENSTCSATGSLRTISFHIMFKYDNTGEIEFFEAAENEYYPDDKTVRDMARTINNLYNKVEHIRNTFEDQLNDKWLNTFRR